MGKLKFRTIVYALVWAIVSTGSGLSDFVRIGLSDCVRIGLSDCVRSVVSGNSSTNKLNYSFSLIIYFFICNYNDKPYETTHY